MNKQEYRASQEYKDCVAKITGYRHGFEFALPWYRMPEPAKRGMEILLGDCVKMGLIESISIGLDITGTIVEERYKRL